jgi:hypothetical protein
VFSSNIPSLHTERSLPPPPPFFPPLLPRKNSGDLHEALNLGLDPLIAETLPTFQEAAKKAKEEGGEIEKVGENLWPSEESWSGAGEFVRIDLRAECVLGC